MQIAVFAGSFDPLHKGHLAILEHLSKTSGIDGVYLVVTSHNPLKGEDQEQSGQRRFESAKAVLAKHPELKVKADDIEMATPGTHYTIATLRALKRREPGNDFVFVMGADNLDDIHRWKDYPAILLEFGALVFPRNGFDAKEIKRQLLAENPAYRITLIDAPLVDISSTDIRHSIANGEDVSGQIA